MNFKVVVKPVEPFAVVLPSVEAVPGWEFGHCNIDDIRSDRIALLHEDASLDQT